jgi:hypothetical protein
MELTDTAWNEWLRKGRASERRRAAFRWRAGKWITGLGLLTAAALYSDRMPYEVAVRSLAAIGALIAIGIALRPRHPSLEKGTK